MEKYIIGVDEDYYRDPFIPSLLTTSEPPAHAEESCSCKVLLLCWLESTVES